MKEKVEKMLIKWGNNEEDVKKMIAEHFEYASEKYSTPERIAEVIRTIY